MEDRDRFSNLPTLDSDDKIIDAVLSGLTHCRLKECQPFVLHRQAMDLSTVSRVVSFMKTENLIDYKVGEYDSDAFDYELRLTERGDLIANSGGWVAHLEGKLTESDWIDKVLKDAKQGIVVLMRSTPNQYQDAVLRLVDEGFLTDKTYRLTLKGREALKAGSYDKWQEQESDQKRQAANKPTSITIHGPVTGSAVGQDLSFRDLNSQSPIIKNEPQQNHPKQKAENSSHTIWDKIKYISVIIGSIAAAVAAISKIAGLW